jgi:hypothetical protein
MSRHWDLRSFKNTFMAVETSAIATAVRSFFRTKPWFACKNLQLQTRSLTFAPQPGSMSRAMQERASVGAALAAFDGAGDVRLSPSKRALTLNDVGSRLRVLSIFGP